MIPRYPAFKPLELSDYTEVSAITRRFPPYSDFNFVSLWSWNTSGKCQISTLHGNLVVRMADYVTGAPLYSFLGDGAVTETAEELLRRADDEGVGGALRLIPESVAMRLDRSRTSYEMDLDGSDYILSTARLRSFKGAELQKKRNWVNRFVREHPAHRVVELDLSSHSVSAELLSAFEAWADRKGTPDVFDLAEYRAFQRLLRAADFFPDLQGIGVYINNELAAFMVMEFVQRKFAMGHFSKAADDAYAGLTPFLMREIGEFLASRGYEQFNHQQDLGMPGLRHSKKSYIPAAYLRKYVVTRSTATSARPSRLSIPAVSDAFLTSGMVDVFGVGSPLTLRAPSISADLMALAQDDDTSRERDRATVRKSRITLLPDAEAGEEFDPSERHDSKTG